jgi:RNA polymerase primary sigma factor
VKTERPGTEHDALGLYLREIGKIPLLSPEEEVRLARRVRRGDQQAREKMILANLRLVVKIAHDYSYLGMPLQDLINEGNIGLMKAVDRFNPRKGAKLSTYGAWWIKQSIRRALANQSKIIRLPVHVVDMVSRLQRRVHDLAEKLGREPTDDELAAVLDTSRAYVAHLRRISVRPASLNAPVGDEETEELSELIGDEAAPTPFDSLRDKSLQDELNDLIKQLDPRDAEILMLRFGLDGRAPRTLEDVGRRFHVTRERIRQLQNGALHRLRRLIQKRDRPAVFSAN